MITANQFTNATFLEGKFHKYWLVTKTSLQNNLAYIANLCFETFFYLFYVFIFTQLWRTVFRQQPNIAGYSLPQMIWYAVIAEMISFSSSNVFQELNNEIKGGNIAYTLNKPYHYIWYQLANEAGSSFFRLLFKAVIGVSFGLIVIGPLNGFQLISIFPLIWVVFQGMLLNFFILTCLGLTTFWLEENTAFFWIYQKLQFMFGLFLPIEFFPPWLQKIAFILPFSYITYSPAKLGVDFSWPVFYRIWTIQLLFIVGFGSLAFWIYRWGVRRLNVNGG